MSEENSQAGSQAEAETSSQAEKEQYVPRKAYEDTTKDMHKFKSRAKDAEARANELEARLKAIEEEKLVEKQQWEELYKQRDAEFESLKNEVEERDRKYLEGVKRNALKQELGGKVKDEFLLHANLENIQFTDSGSIDNDSLLNVANDFRQRYPEVIPAESVAKPTEMAAASNDTVGNSSLKPLSQMSLNEKKALLKDPAMQDLYRQKGLL